MTITATGVSPLNCRWITWESNLPVCRRPAGTPHCVSEAECEACTLWTPAAEVFEHDPAALQSLDRGDLASQGQGCPRCGSRDVVLAHRDAVVQSLTCAICRQQWLATSDL